MTNDLLKEILKIGDKMKPFHVKPKEKALVTILDIHKFKKKKHNNTTYYLFQAIIESVDGKQENQNNTYIQLPSKKVIYPLFKSIVAKGMSNEKQFKLEITKKDNYNWSVRLEISPGEFLKLF